METNTTAIMPHPPHPNSSDQIQLILLVLMFCIGAPLNLASFTTLLKQRSSKRTGRLNMLKLHLNMTDLMVLFIYVTARTCHQITYEWRGGEALCKIVKFLNSTSFQASSNLIVAVAMDRLFTVLNGAHWYKSRFKRRTFWYVRLCLSVAWISAIAINLPQLYVWTLYAPYPTTNPNWHQCVTVYAVNSHKAKMAFSKSSDFKWRPIVSQFTYDMSHLLLVFWIPVLLIIMAYSVVIFRLYRLEAKRNQAMKHAYYENVAAALPLKHASGTRKGSLDSSIRRISIINQEPFLSPTRPRSTIDSRKESQSTTASSQVYLVPISISRIRNNTFRTSFMLIVAYMIFWAPYNALAVWQFVDDGSFRRHVEKAKFLNTLIVLNSVVNPFLYGGIKLRWLKYN